MGLVRAGHIGLPALIERLTVGPSRVMGGRFDELATLKEGTPADIVIFDPDREWVVDPREFASKGRNTPLAGTTLRGRVAATLVAGKIAYREQGFKEKK